MHRKGSAMRKLLLAGAAALSIGIAGPARAADMPLGYVAPLPIFNWTSCFLGAHIGGGWAHKDFTDPVALVQNSMLGTVTPGVTTVGVSSSGLIIGGQMGCDYQFGFSPWVVGVEGAVSGGNLRGNTNFVLPLGGSSDIATLTAKTDFLPSVTARVGYALDNWLFYVRAGGAWAGDKYSVTGTFLPTATAFGLEGVDNRFGWTAGDGVEWAFAEVWSARLAYDYYGFGRRSALMTDPINGFTGVMNVQQSVQTLKLGVSFHMWAGQ
jgi:outer membrane immunogenic protein